MVKTRTIKLKQPDTGETLPEVTLKIYPTLKGMRSAARQSYPDDADEDCKALGFVQPRNLSPTIRLCDKAMSMRIIVHECLHAAIYLRYTDEAKWNIPDEDLGIAWNDELICHIMDDLFTAVLDHLIRLTPNPIPLDYWEAA